MSLLTMQEPCSILSVVGNVQESEPHHIEHIMFYLETFLASVPQESGLRCFLLFHISFSSGAVWIS